ncbi:MAG: MotA/TolQ/ExbB proton channel family protein, partial [Coprococcus sp.]
MKKLGEKGAIYVVLLALLGSTLILGRNGSNSMVLNYVFLAVMGVLIFVMDRWGLRRIGMMEDDLRNIADRIIGNKTEQQFMNAMQESKEGSDPYYLQNQAYLDRMEKLDFRHPSVNRDWHRLLQDWQLSGGMDCEVEDYLFEDEMLEYSNYNICMQVPGILTALGILGTFLGLVIGLQGFDFSNADQMTLSVEALVGGLNVAFYTSIYGVSLSIIYNFILRRRITKFGQELNRFYDVFHAVLKPISQWDLVDRFSDYQKAQNALLDDMKQLLNERFGERLAGQMAETLMPVFERINQSLDHMMLDFHKEQADSLEKIVDAFVIQMSGALNSHVNALGESVDQLSDTQKNMSMELQQLIRQIAQTGSDTAKINEQAGEILKQLNGYVPQLEKTARDSAEIIAQMGHWSESIQNMSAAQSEILQTLSEHEGNLDETCAKINANQEVLNSRLVDFTEAAKVLARREHDPMQYADLKEMLTAYMTTMQGMQNSNAERMENLWKQMTSEEKNRQA